MSEDRGCMVVVVGPSGAGKDSVLRSARLYFANEPGIGFVRRVITRPCHPESEVHDSVDEPTFLTQLEAGRFAVHWRANNLYYGLPIETLQAVQSGSILIANGSRAAVADFIRVYPRVLTVQITANHDELLKRLTKRQRESQAQIEQRLARTATLPPLPGNVIEIDNSHKLETATAALIRCIEDL